MYLVFEIGGLVVSRYILSHLWSTKKSRLLRNHHQSSQGERPQCFLPILSPCFQSLCIMCSGHVGAKLILILSSDCRVDGKQVHYPIGYWCFNVSQDAEAPSITLFTFFISKRWMTDCSLYLMRCTKEVQNNHMKMNTKQLEPIIQPSSSLFSPCFEKYSRTWCFLIIDTAQRDLCVINMFHSHTRSTQIDVHFVLMLWGLLLAIDWRREKSCQAYAAERNNYWADVRG